jgi:hypothetical protein
LGKEGVHVGETKEDRPKMNPTRRCFVPTCEKPAAGSMLLEVEGSPSELPACPDHSEWLADYAEEDDQVQLSEPPPHV